MRRTLAARGAVALLVTGATLVVTVGLGAPSAQARRCDSASVHALINGKHRCLRSGHGCSRALDRHYHRYRFHCHFGFLEADVWALLRRPLRLPTLDAGDPCEVSRARQVAVRWGAALGDGPVFAVMGLVPGAARRPLDPAAGRAGGYLVKTIWIGESYVGPFLVRGRRLNDHAVVAFSDSETRTPAPEARMVLRPYAGAWREAYGPRYTRVPGRGCYALQVDGFGFSFVIMFEAVERPE